MAGKPLLTVEEASRELGFSGWQVRALFTSGRLPEPVRVGTSRAIPRRDLPKIAAALAERFRAPAAAVA